MRYSVELCEEEKKFLQKREQFVFEAMKKLLGKDGPKTIDEVSGQSHKPSTSWIQE